MILKGNNIDLKKIEKSDLEDYFKAGFVNVDEEMLKFTGSSGDFTLGSISKYLDKIVGDKSRYDFLILDKEAKILGEIVLNEIDLEEKSSHFRIALFKSPSFGRGIGRESMEILLAFAFEELGLEVIELEVFSFNERGIRLYSSLGFKENFREVEEDYEVINMTLSRD